MYLMKSLSIQRAHLDNILMVVVELFIDFSHVSWLYVSPLLAIML